MGDNDDIGAMVIQLMKPHVSPFPSGWLPWWGVPAKRHWLEKTTSGHQNGELHCSFEVFNFVWWKLSMREKYVVGSLSLVLLCLTQLGCRHHWSCQDRSYIIISSNTIITGIEKYLRHRYGLVKVQFQWTAQWRWRLRRVIFQIGEHTKSVPFQWRLMCTINCAHILWEITQKIGAHKVGTLNLYLCTIRIHAQREALLCNA